MSARLIDQMGGLQGCRVFKICGVRSLIKKYSPAKSFERTEAVTMIGNNDPVSHHPRFDAYKSLYIEPRDKQDLKPEDAFLYLLKKGVFRAGLKLECPTCQLDFWVPLTTPDPPRSVPIAGSNSTFCRSYGIETGRIAVPASSGVRITKAAGYRSP